MNEDKITALNDHFYNKYGMIKQDFTNEIREINFHQGLIVEEIEKNQEIFEKYFKRFTVNETYFFREYLPEIFIDILNKIDSDEIRIWSCGCSTGCEAFSIAMLMNFFFPDVKYSIMASDINKSNLETVKAGGPFAERDLSRFQSTPSGYSADLDIIIKDSFYNNQAGWFVKDEIKNKISVELINLNSLETHRFKNKFDIIFCRNVLFYFNENSWDYVTEILAAALKKEGYFIVSPYETSKRKLLNFFELMPVKRLTGIFYLQKKINNTVVNIKNNIDTIQFKGKKIKLEDFRMIDNLPFEIREISILNKRVEKNSIHYNFNLMNRKLIFKCYFDSSAKCSSEEINLRLFKLEQYENVFWDNSAEEYIFNEYAPRSLKKILLYIIGYMRSSKNFTDFY